MIGKRLGRYEVLARLGAGGMGEVYRARDLDLGRSVALKMLPQAVQADPERLHRFEHEARAASALNHPNIVTIYEIGYADAVPFIAMELVEGSTLRALLGRRPFLTKRVLALAAQATEGLAKAHEAGIVHRDLKPENIMVTRDGFVKILDFGLAKLQDSGAFNSEAVTASPATRPGVVMGTVGYMSPEQARGKPLDFRSDQFSCGAILYEMATGKRAFDRETPFQTLAAIIDSEPEPIQSINPDVPPPFRWIVERCLKKIPEERYASTLDLARELRNVHDRLDEVSSGPRTMPPFAFRSRAWRRSASLAAALAVAVALGSAGWLWRAAAPLPLTSARVPREKQIAVLGFTNSSGAEPDRVFCDGLVETLISKLTLLEQFQGSLWLVPASEIRSSGATSVQDARKAFGVTLAITGSAHRTGDRVRMIANLVDAASLRQLRSVTIDRPLGDLLTLQDGIASAIAEMLELELQPEARRLLSAGGTTIPGAYDHYVRGRGYLQRYEKPESLDLAAASFQRALEQDPSYTLAYAGLGETYWRRYNLTRSQEWIDLARRSCKRAAELNDLLAPVHVTLGMINQGTGRYEDAVAAFEVALKLDPVSVDAYRGLASTYESLGRLDQAETTYRKAIELKPSLWSNHSYLGVFYYRHARYSEAVSEFRRVIELTPDNVRGYNNLSGAYQKLGRLEDAIAALQKSLTLKPTANAYSNLGTTYFFQGRYAEAVPLMEKALALGVSQQLVWGNLGDAYRWTRGNEDKAPEAYRRAIALAEQELKVNPKDAQIRAAYATYWAKLGNPAKALDEAARARQTAPSHVSVLFRCSLAYELTGKREQALEALGAALRGGYSIDEVRRDPDLEALRQDRRYLALLASVGTGAKPSR